MFVSFARAAAPDDLAARVVIVANARQPESVSLARHYAAGRGIPHENIVALPMPDAESVTWRQFVDQVHQPLQDELVRRSWIEATRSELRDGFGRRRATFHGHHMAFLVVCRGVPLRIHHDPGMAEPRVRVPAPQFRSNQAAVDGELALLAWANPPALGFVPNPLFGKDRPTDVELRQVVRVARLDGPSWEDARQLVDSALAGERAGPAGRYYVDLRGPHADGDRWLEQARRQLDERGFDGDVESTGATFAADARFDAPVWYLGWYAGDLNGPFRRASFRFPPGAVALHIHSFSAATLHSRESGWTGPLVARGVTATVGNVFEPYLQLTHRPDLLVRGLLAGRTFGEAAYEALPALGWQATAVGDPLFRPWPREASPAPDSPPSVVRAARLRERGGDRAGAIALLRASLDRTPSLASMLVLAGMQERAGDADGARSTLAPARLLPEHRGEQWPVARQVARELARLGAETAALDVYRALADSSAPNPEAAAALLEEARALADRSGEGTRSRDFARRQGEAGTR
ncbi:MAG TPA: TIGR03790 family protein [Opitutaceae bacterium]|nr:TIGR03790 family protein [Opitutaceae bacterium]